MHYARNPEVLWRSTSHGPVVLLGDGDPVRLGGLAAVVWEVLDHGADSAGLQEMVGAVVGDHPDVIGPLTELVQVGLVLVEPPPHPADG